MAGLTSGYLCTRKRSDASPSNMKHQDLNVKRSGRAASARRADVAVGEIDCLIGCAYEEIGADLATRSTCCQVESLYVAFIRTQYTLHVSSR